MVFMLPLFTKLTITQYVFMDISCTKLYPNRAKNVENASKMSPLVKHGVHRTDHYKTHNCLTTLSEDLSIEFHPSRRRNMETTGRNTLRPLGTVWPSLS